MLKNVYKIITAEIYICCKFWESRSRVIYHFFAELSFVPCVQYHSATLRSIPLPTIGHPQPHSASLGRFVPHHALDQFFKGWSGGVGDREVGGKNFGQFFNVNSRYKRVHKQINIYYIYWKHFSFLSLSSVFVLFHYNFFKLLFFYSKGTAGKCNPH